LESPLCGDFPPALVAAAGFLALPAWLRRAVPFAFVHAHNAFVDRARASGQPEARVFDVAARGLIWHYQTVVLREFLPSLIGAERRPAFRRGNSAADGRATIER
jgi:hypothetical protein